VSKIDKGRYTADVTSLGDEVVVFLIGMRVNRPWRLRKWWPVFTALPKMLRYLEQHPEKGLLGFRQAVLPSPILVQYFAVDRFDRRRLHARIGVAEDDLPVLPPY
jgi:hypothetical protein